MKTMQTRTTGIKRILGAIGLALVVVFLVGIVAGLGTGKTETDPTVQTTDWAIKTGKTTIRNNRSIGLVSDDVVFSFVNDTASALTYKIEVKAIENEKDVLFTFGSDGMYSWNQNVVSDQFFDMTPCFIETGAGNTWTLKATKMQEVLNAYGSENNIGPQAEILSIPTVDHFQMTVKVGQSEIKVSFHTDAHVPVTGLTINQQEIRVYAPND